MIFKKKFYVIVFVAFFTLPACWDENSDANQNSPVEENSKNNRLIELEKEIELLKWENARLSLKLRSVDGAALVRDVQTNLWHFESKVLKHEIGRIINGEIPHLRISILSAIYMTKYAVHEFMGENKNKFFIIESFAEFGIDKDIVTIGGKGVAPI